MEEKETFIAFMDIMGFKDLVDNNTHENLMRKVNKLLVPTIERALSHGKSVDIEQDGQPARMADVREIKINSLSISDSIIFWTDDCSLDSFIQIISVVHHLLNSSFHLGLPMRGGISLGNLTFNNLAFGLKTHNYHTQLIGNGLVDAYILEGKQEWSGCVVDEKCIKKIIEIQPDMATNENWFLHEKAIIKYNTPYKSGTIKEDYVIRWPSETNQLNEQRIRKAFASHNKTCTEVVENKIQNTIKFVEYCSKFEIKSNS